MTTLTEPLLFTPIRLRDITLKNRVVVAPMHQYAAEKGFTTDWHLVNAGRYAAGGAGLVFMESTKVDRRGCGTVGDLGRSEEHTSELQSLMRNSYAVFCLKTKTQEKELIRTIHEHEKGNNHFDACRESTTYEEKPENTYHQ